MSVTRIEANVNTCPECGSNLTTDKGEAYCRNCGLVVEEGLLNLNNKFSGGSNDDKPNPNQTGVGADPDSNIMHDKGLGSQISFQNKDSKGNSIDSSKRAQLNRIRRWQRAYQFDGHESRGRKAVMELLRYANQMDMGENVVQMAGQLFKQAHKTDIAIGRSLDALADAVVYISAKQMGQTREWEEWIENANTSESLFRVMVREVKDELDIGFMPSKPSDYAPQILENLYITDENRKQIYDLLEAVEENLSHIGRKPQGIVAACIYLGATYTTQKEVSKAADVSKATVRKVLNDMEQLEATNGCDYYE